MVHLRQFQAGFTVIRQNDLIPGRAKFYLEYDSVRCHVINDEDLAVHTLKTQSIFNLVPYCVTKVGKDDTKVVKKSFLTA